MRLHADPPPLRATASDYSYETAAAHATRDVPIVAAATLAGDARTWPRLRKRSLATVVQDLLSLLIYFAVVVRLIP